MYDLIYTDAEGVEQGCLTGYVYTMQYGLVDNTFDVVFGLNDAPEGFGAGSFIYAEGTDYGGIVRSRQIDTLNKTMTFSGATWHGVLNEHINRPPSGSAYWTFKGDAHEFLRELLASVDLSAWFIVPDEPSKIEVTCELRYACVYEAMIGVLGKVSAKPVIAWRRDHAEVRAVAASVHIDATDDNAEIVDEHCFMPVNHLVCLGRGRLLNREIIDLYVNEAGEIGFEQYYFGLDEVAKKYENTNTDVEEDDSGEQESSLLDDAIKYLSELRDSDILDVSAELVDNYDVGDIVEVVNQDLGVKARTVVTSKTVTLGGSYESFSCEVGNVGELERLVIN